MTCSADFATFRLLDALVGWDPASAKGLSGLDSLGGVTLAPIAPRIDGTSIAKALPPARLARGCSPCEWYFVTCCPPQSRFLRLDACAPEFRPVWNEPCEPDVIRCATAVAVHCDRIAVSDSGAHWVWLWRHHGAQLIGSIPMHDPGPVAWAPWDEWLVADRGALRMRRYDPSGGERADAVPLPGTAERLGVDAECSVWLVTREQDLYRVWRWARGEPRFVIQTIEDLLAAFPDTGARQVGERWFCIEDQSAGTLRRRCFDCYGHAGTPPSESQPKPLYAKQGQLLTLAVDSGMPRTRWHRVRIDADIPAGTDLSIAVSTQEEVVPISQGSISEDPGWEGFPGGVPHPQDWQISPHGALDFAMSQPPGRYLFLRARFTGDGARTPVLRRIRLDFPRRTSLDSLPAVYRENPKAEAFSERFLAIFDAAIEDIDRAIERHPALLEVDAVPNEVLPWLGSFLDVAMDPAWTAKQRRAVLKAVPELYRRRGTPEGLRRTIKLLFDTDSTLQETALTRPWAPVGKARLDQIRLFGRSQARMRVGRSALSRTPVWSVGDPNLDPLNAGAFRFRVLVPGMQGEEMRGQLARIVESQKPAHTVASVYGGSGGFIVGQNVHVGIDTALVALPAPVLGQATRGVRLGRNSVLWSNRICSGSAFRIGRDSAIGINTVME